MRKSTTTAEKWLQAGLEVLRPPAFFQGTDVDMSASETTIRQHSEQGKRVTYTHLLVWSVAKALSEVDNEPVEIGVSVGGDSFVAPVMVVSDPQEKSFHDLALEIIERTPAIRADDRRFHKLLNRWGWLVPTKILKRFVIRILMSVPGFSRKGTGTFQVSMAPWIEESTAPMFSTTGIVVGGAVESKIVCCQNQPAVKPVMRITLAADHRKWNGQQGGTFLKKVKWHMENLGTC